MLTKDKQKVIGEELDQTKIARFLEMKPNDEQDADFHILLRAYRGLPADAFEQFLGMFAAEGRNINAADKDGKTLLQMVQDHQRQQGYVEALQKHGAK